MASSISCVPRCVIHWSKYSLGNSSHVVHYGYTCSMGISIVFQRSVTVPLHSPNSRQMLGLCKGTVEQSMGATMVPHQAKTSYHEFMNSLIKSYEKYSWLLLLFEWFNLVTDLHMSWQLSCHGMCKVGTWSHHYFSCEHNAYFHNIWIKS